MLKFKTSCAVLANLSSNLLNEVGLSLIRYFEVGLRVCDIVVNKYVRYLISWWVLVVINCRLAFRHYSIDYYQAYSISTVYVLINLTDYWTKISPQLWLCWRWRAERSSGRRLWLQLTHAVLTRRRVRPANDPALRLTVLTILRWQTRGATATDPPISSASSTPGDFDDHALTQLTGSAWMKHFCPILPTLWLAPFLPSAKFLP